jgi:molecular chaperone DnaK
MGRSIGIDLGTTNSVGSYVDDRGSAVIISSRDPSRPGSSEYLRYTPSVVSMRRHKVANAPSKEEILVGLKALNNARIAPKDTIYSFKRLMGRSVEDEKVKAARDRLTYEIAAGEGTDRNAHALLAGKKVSPEELSAKILSQIREDADVLFGTGAVTHAVITVPAYFEERQREATRRAGSLAGLQVKMILDEPVAAAIAHGLAENPSARRRLLVLDLGGGTFDISIVQQAGKRFHVVQTGGDMWLGGDDFDRAVIGIIERKMRDKGFPFPEDARSRFELRMAAEVAKRAFANRPTVDVFLSGIRGPAEQLDDFDCYISRAEFDRAIEPLLARTESLIRELLQQEDLRPEQFEYALLVGGSSELPQFKDVVRRVFGERLRSVADPMEAVARGAAITAQSLVGVTCIREGCKQPQNREEDELCQGCGASLAPARPAFAKDTGQLDDIRGSIPRALGIACIEGANTDAYQVIIPANTPYPMKKAFEYTFRLGAGQKIVVPIYEGGNPRAARNLHQGTVEEKPPQQLQHGDPVTVGLNYTRHRTLDITISYPTLNTSHTFHLSSIRPPAPRTSDEENWLEQLSTQIRTGRALLSRFAKFLPAPQRQRLEDLIPRAESALFTADEKVMRQLMHTLMEMIWGERDGRSVALLLFLAEVVAGITSSPTVTAELEKLAAELRRSYELADRSQTTRVQNQLQNLINREMEQNEMQRTKINLAGLLVKTPSAKTR